VSPKTAEEMLASLASFEEDVDAGTVDPTADAGTFQAADQLLEDPLEIAEGVPSGVVDEQAEIFEKAQQASEPDGSKQSEGTAAVDDGVDWKTVAGGRLNEIQSIRTKMAEQGQNIENLRQMWLADAQQKAKERAEQYRVNELKREEELYGPDVVNDPTARYMRDKVAQTQDIIERNRQIEEGRLRETQAQSMQYQRERAAQQQAMGALEVMEAELTTAQPDYPEAYTWAVNKRADMYESRGYTTQQAQEAVRNEEAALFAEQMQMGGNPAKVAYDLAVQWGWKPEMVQQAAPAAPVPTNTQKLQAGVKSGGVAQLPGQAKQTHGDGQTITAQQFFDTVPEPLRIQILGDADKFEELGRTGMIRVDW